MKSTYGFTNYTNKKSILTEKNVNCKTFYKFYNFTVNKKCPYCTVRNFGPGIEKHFTQIGDLFAQLLCSILTKLMKSNSILKLYKIQVVTS